MKKNNTPLISVIVPTYNEEKTIPLSLESILNQDFSEKFEIIVVNGPSTDKTVDVIKRFPVKLINLKKRGIGIAWNAGVKKAKGKIIAFTEADTIVPKYWLSSIYSALKKKGTAGTFGRYEFMDRSVLLNKLVLLSMLLTDSLSKVFFGHYCFRGTNFAVKRKILVKAGGFDKNIRSHGDIELSIRMSKVGKIIYQPNLIVKTDDRIISSLPNFIKFLRRFTIAFYNIFISKTPSKVKNFDIR